MFKIYPYKTGSKSAQILKQELNGLILKTENSKYRHRDDHIVINWGNSERPTHLVGVPIFNPPEAVAVTVNKLKTFEQLQDEEIPVVPFTSSKETAEDWLLSGEKVFVRHKLTGHSGEGIEVIKSEEHLDTNQLQRISSELSAIGYDSLSQVVNGEIESLDNESIELPDAPLYTIGISNAGEYRVHVFDGDVILYQKKSRRVDDDGNVVTAEGAEADVRNLASNWIYRTGNLKPLERVENLAIDAIRALNLDFGAVDIIMDNDGEVYVLEVNSAPGLGNTDTKQAYVDAINSLV